MVKRWLSNIPDTWLVIFDNADDPDLDISVYFPVGNRGTILITTRNPDCKVHATDGSWREVVGMQTDEAVSLMLKESGHDSKNEAAREMAKPVVSMLGCLALAITQAGAVIRQGVCGISEYCQLYSKRRKGLLDQKSMQSAGDYQYTVNTTWEISLRVIGKKSSDFARDAVELLQIFSFLHYEGISEEIFREAWRNMKEKDPSGWTLTHQPHVLSRQSSPDWDSYIFGKAISVLTSFSLISRDRNNLISIHPLVHSWARDRMTPSDEERFWRLTVSTLAASITFRYESSDYRFRRSLVPHLNACNRVFAGGILRICDEAEECLVILEKLALVYRESGQWSEALRLTEQVVEARRRTLGEEHPETLRSMHNLAIRFSEAGRRPEALRLAEQVVEAHRRTLGEEHPDTVYSMHSLAIYFSKAGRRPEALRLTEQVVEAHRRTLGEEHPETLRSMHNLAARFSEAGRRPEALRLAEQVVEARRRMLGEEHPDTLRSMHSLAIRFSEAGRGPEALRLTEQVVEAHRRTLGEEHPDTLYSMHNLAIHFSEAGRGPEALRLAEQVVEACRRTLGEEHPDTLRSMHSLSIRFSEAGRGPEALRLAEQVVEASRRTLGEEHPETLYSMHNLAIRFSEAGRGPEALRLAEQVVEARRRTLGEKHPDTVSSIHNLALL
jgi:tetratricopeptide (TPR) repeat protein